MTPKEESKHLLKEIYREVSDPSARVDRIVSHFGKLVKGIGKHKYRKVKLSVDPSVPPRIQPQRKIAFAKRD
jgi:hypothetical protein